MKRDENGNRVFSGKFLLRVPVSLHEALVAEADNEGVSLNQLCAVKLSETLAEKLSKKLGKRSEKR